MVHDIKFWKASRLIKDADDLADCYKVVISYAKEIVEVFTNLAGKSAYPGVTGLDISNFCEESKIIDQDRIKIATVDRTIIASNTANVEE